MTRRVKKRGVALPCPVAASQVIAHLRSDLSAEAQFMIRELCKRRLTIQEVMGLLVRGGFRRTMKGEAKLIASLHATRYKGLRQRKRMYRGPVFGFWHGEWYVVGSLVDPSVKSPIRYQGTVVPHDRFHLFYLVEDILVNSAPLTLGQLIDAVIAHPAFMLKDQPRTKIRVGVDNVLRKNTWRFEKRKNYFERIPKRFARWSVTINGQRPTRKPTPKRVPPKAKKERRPKQRDILYALMRTRNVIAGWTLDEILAAVEMPGSEFAIDSTLSLNERKLILIDHFRSPREKRFQKIKRGRKTWYYALPTQRARTPRDSTDWDTIVTAIGNDDGHYSHATLVENALRHGWRFSWDVSTIGRERIGNQITLAMQRLRILV